MKNLALPRRTLLGQPVQEKEFKQKPFLDFETPFDPNNNYMMMNLFSHMKKLPPPLSVLIGLKQILSLTADIRGVNSNGGSEASHINQATRVPLTP